MSVKLVITLGAFFAKLTAIAVAQTLPEDTFLNFEAICLSEINTPAKFAERTQEMGASELSPNLAALLLANRPGRAFRLRSEKQPLYVLIADPGQSCTVTSRDADGPATEAVFVKFIKHNTLESEDVGSERFDYFAVTYSADPSLPGHAIVIVHYSKLIPGVQIAMMPGSAISSLGIGTPTWP
jgi:hypothetical protein